MAGQGIAVGGGYGSVRWVTHLDVDDRAVEAVGRAWAVMVELDDETRLGTGVQAAGAARRIVRIDGETAQPGRLLDYLRPVWATPEQDRLFSDARAARLKFFDRLVFAADPDHAASVSAYEKALRERLTRLPQ